MKKSKLKPNLFNALMMVLFVSVFFQSCGFKPLTFDSVDNIEVLDIQDSLGTLILTMTATNPNKKPVQISNLEAELGINTVDVGVVKQGKPFEIPANGTHTVKVPFTLTLQNNVIAIAAGLSLAIFTDNLEVKINGKANGQYGKVKIPIPIGYHEKISTKDVKGLWDN